MGITSPRFGGGGGQRQKQKQRRVGGVRLERKGRRRAGSLGRKGGKWEF